MTMTRILTRVAIAGLAIALLACGWPAAAQARPQPAELGQVVQEVENLDLTRSNLAATIDEEPTLDTFKEVCKPIGMRAKQLSQENGWQVKQVATKYRNPKHAPMTAGAEAAIARFEADPELMGFWDKETIDGQAGNRYFRRIDVEASCLACHGAKAERPEFVKERYPDDRAYDFAVGDLRGIYAVFVPELKADLQAALVATR